MCSIECSDTAGEDTATAGVDKRVAVCYRYEQGHVGLLVLVVTKP